MWIPVSANWVVALLPQLVIEGVICGHQLANSGGGHLVGQKALNAVPKLDLDLP